MVWWPIGIPTSGFCPYTKLPSLPQSTVLHISHLKAYVLSKLGSSLRYEQLWKSLQHNTEIFFLDLSFSFWHLRGFSFWSSERFDKTTVFLTFLWLKSLDILLLTLSVLLCYLITWTKNVYIPSAPAAFTGRGVWSTPDFAVILDEMSL